MEAFGIVVYKTIHHKTVESYIVPLRYDTWSNKQTKGSSKTGNRQTAFSLEPLYIGCL